MTATAPRGLIAMSRETLPQVLSPSALRRLASIADVEGGRCVTDFDDPAAVDALREAEFLLTGWGAPTVTPEVLARAPRLRFVAHAAGTVRHHLPRAVWEAGVAVSTAADVNARFVADYSVAMIRLALKGVFAAADRYRRVGWPATEDRQDSVPRVVGLVGASRIGRRVLARIRDDVTVLVHDPYWDAVSAAASGAELTDLDDLCRRCDVLSIHAPQLPETRHLVDARRLGLLRDGATVINTARGSLVDTDALTAECVAGRLSAILDVTDPEPLPVSHPLLSAPTVIVTPHLAGAQGHETAALGEFAIDEIGRFFRGERPIGLVDANTLDRIALSPQCTLLLGGINPLRPSTNDSSRIWSILYPCEMHMHRCQ